MDLLFSDYLYIGNASDAKDRQALKARSITAVVNVATDLVSPPEVDPIRVKVGLTDGPSNSDDAYQLAADTVDYLLRKGHKVLIHCHEGRSRTSAVASLWLRQNTSHQHITGAWATVYKARPLCAKMEPCHMENLRRYLNE